MLMARPARPTRTLHAYALHCTSSALREGLDSCCPSVSSVKSPKAADLTTLVPRRRTLPGQYDLRPRACCVTSLTGVCYPPHPRPPPLRLCSLVPRSPIRYWMASPYSNWARWCRPAPRDTYSLRSPFVGGFNVRWRSRLRASSLAMLGQSLACSSLRVWDRRCSSSNALA